MTGVRDLAIAWGVTVADVREFAAFHRVSLPQAPDTPVDPRWVDWLTERLEWCAVMAEEATWD